ncbi:MAG TPA: sensor histidine kinase, partial [Bacteroidia bacterium]|nr:sensor histidine kinase [Bacteroidia bacterium]
RTKAIIDTQEAERKRIAQDLHDGIGQNLTAAKMNFESYVSRLEGVTSSQKIIFDQIETILEDTQKEVRALSHSMMPRALQESELGDATSDLLEQTFANSAIRYSFDKHLPPDLPENTQICLYRVLQELLSNILRHAQATEVAVQLFKSQNHIILMVEDNGKGIGEHQSDGIGLQSISARVHALNGSFTLEPGPLKGTIATVRIQLASL